jgi:DNA-directed RNA polymerase II subunit RPB2
MSKTELKKGATYTSLEDAVDVLPTGADDVDEKLHESFGEQPWKVIESYFSGQHLKRLVRHQVESYNDFVTVQIKRTIQMFNNFTILSQKDYNEEVDKYGLEIHISFDNFRIHTPQIFENNGASKTMFPQEARLRNFTYAGLMSVDIHFKITMRCGDDLSRCEIKHKTLKNIHIGKLPVMLKSCICVLNQYRHLPTAQMGECEFDAGGYFIINGSEKTVIAQERAAENKVFCFNNTKSNNKWAFSAEVKSVPDDRIISPKHISMYVANRSNGFGRPIYVQLPRMKQPIPLFVLFRALGVVSDAAICDYVLLNKDEAPKDLLYQLRGSIVDACEVTTQEEAFELVKNNVAFTPINMTAEKGEEKKRQYATDILSHDLFPHCKTAAQKRFYLGYMTNRLIRCASGAAPPDDRDSYLNKRIDLVGILLNNLFRNYFNKLVKDMQKQIVKEINNGSWRSTNDYYNIINHTNIYKIVKSSTVENGLKRALSTGDFGIRNTNSNKVGIAQVLNRLTYVASLSHLRRVNTPIDKNGKLVEPRKLHSTSWGYICPAETPEGASVGVVKNISYMAHITVPSYSSHLYEILAPRIQLLTDDTSPRDLHGAVKVFVNGCWYGTTTDPNRVFCDLKQMKSTGVINIHTGIVTDYAHLELRVLNEGGRMTRPLLKVKDNRLLLTNRIAGELAAGRLAWNDLFVNHRLGESVMEYVDVDEQNMSMVAMTPRDLLRATEVGPGRDSVYRYTHCEIHPSTIFGVLASCIPFPEHNQSPRNTYQSAQAKQAMGMYVTNFDKRMDKTSYVLSYPMRPMVDTRVMNMLNMNRIPSGEMVIVAIGAYGGYNQEDSIIFNKGALDRGLFSATIYHTIKDEDRKAFGDEEVRCKPDPTKTRGIRFGNYDKLNRHGLVPENTFVEDRDVIVGKVVPIRENKNDHSKLIKFQDGSHVHRAHEATYIDKNFVGRNGDGYTFCKVRLRNYRKPIIGDKFSSRAGQKGTIGVILPEEDMPFTADGVRPDIIINPHAIPSRMTIGQLKETLLSKVITELGLFGDGTSFCHLDVETICEQLQNVGYERHGNELLMNGFTGQQLEANIFIGPTFYQRLKHMVSDKQHSRSIGPMVMLTRQPAEGRARDGGLRFGEMERDAMIAHGASRFTRGRMYDASDKFSVHVCKDCGMIAAYNDERHIHYCRTCENRAGFAYVELPYACKLLFQELITMNVAPRIVTT